MNTIEQQATLWIVKENDGLNDMEKAQLQSWLNENTKHQDAYNFNKLLQNSFQGLSTNIQETLSKKANKGARRTKIIEMVKPLAIAAMVLLTLSLGTFSFFSEPEPLYMNTYLSQKQINKKILLPDDSLITMDVKSQMNVAFYEDTREVEFVKGKALFSIAKDKNRPFIINAKNTSIEVIGTKFEVSKKEDVTSIKVKEGTVKVSQTYNDYKKKRNYILNKGDQISLSSNGKILSYGKIDIDKIATWEKGFLIFSEIPLHEAIQKFSRYSDIKIQYQNTTVSHTLITGKFAITEFSNFIEALPKIYPFKIEKNKEILKIYQN